MASKTLQVIEMILAKYGKEDEIEEVNGKKVAKSSGSTVDWVEEES